MLTEDELRTLAPAVRGEQVPLDDALLSMIEGDIAAYRQIHEASPTPQPPDELVGRLRLMGWLIYNASYVSLERVAAGFSVLPAAEREASQAASDLVRRLADQARELPWPHFAPRALGAIRAEALVASKQDTRRGYDDAWVAHQEARDKYTLFKELLVALPGRENLLLQLEETLVQLALAETGTACRTAERVIGRWIEGRDESEWTDDEELVWTRRMFRELGDGVTYGEEALETAEWIDRTHGLVHRPDEHRSALVTSYQNPGIMTARALLLLLSMASEMEEELGHPPLFDRPSWDESREELLARFRTAYDYLERPVTNPDGTDRPMIVNHRRSLLQLRLHLGLVVPGAHLPSRLDFAPCLALDRLDAEAVEEISRTLARRDGDARFGDANVIGSATKPSFLRSVEAGRRRYGAAGGYRRWRERWPQLDRYDQEPGRRERVARAFALAYR